MASTSDIVHRGLTAAVLMSQVNDEGGKIMATTTVRKGVNRKAAQAKQAKAAQLPADNLDSLGLPELKQLARAKGWSTVVDRGTAPEIRKALRDYPDGPPAQTKQLFAAAAADMTSKRTNGKRGSSNVDSNQASDNPGVELGRRISAARDNGFSRKDIADASGLTQSVIWRVQAKSVVKPLEVEKLTEALGKIESGQVEPTRRGRPRSATESGGGTKAALQSKLDKVHELLSDVPMNSNKVTEYRAAITAALDVIDDNA